MAQKAALRLFLKSGGDIGWISPYFDHIAVVKWLNQTYGYNLTIQQYLEEWDEWDLNMHLYYADVFNDPRVIREARKRRVRQRLARSGHFSVDVFLHEHPGEE